MKQVIDCVYCESKHKMTLRSFEGACWAFCSACLVEVLAGSIEELRFTLGLDDNDPEDDEDQ